jgi:site-specific DNA-cytosine methylase
VKTKNGSGRIKAVTVELCCGSAGLSLALREQGFEVVAVDWKGNEHKTRCTAEPRLACNRAA